MNDEREHARSENEQHASPVVAIDVVGQIGKAEIQSMARTLAKILVKHALIEHGVIPSNENE